MQKKHVAVRKLGTPRSLCGFNHHSELLNRNVSSFFYGYISANSWCLEICFFQLTYERSSFFIWSNPWFCCLNHHNHHSSGWWLTYPSEKMMESITWGYYSQLESHKSHVPVTTNQICSSSIPSAYDIHTSPWKIMENPPIFHFGKPSISMGLWAMFQPAIVSIRRATKASWSRPSAAASAKA